MYVLYLQISAFINSLTKMLVLCCHIL